MSGPRTGLPTPSCPRPVGPSWSWAHDCPGLGHGQALPVGELGAPPRGESKRKGSGLDQEPEAGRALDSALAGGARGGGEAAERPRGALATRRGPDFGKRSHFPAPLAGRRSRSAGGHPGSTVLSHGPKHKSAAGLPARSSEPGVLLSGEGLWGRSSRGAAVSLGAVCDRVCTGSAGTFY